jgi:hypothetical protein
MAMTRFAVFTAVLLLCGAAFAQTAPTQPPPATSEPETVHSTGQYIDNTWKAARTVNGLLFPVDGSFYPKEQYTRWKDPICFNVYGLAPAAKYVVERRMKEIATRVGAPVNRADPCTPNVTIFFTSDPPVTLQSIADVRPWLVPCVGFIRSRVKESLPIQAWYADMSSGGNGQWILANSCEGSYVFDARGMSILNSGMETQLGAVTILVNTSAIMGMELGALADHFALLSLAEARQSRSCKEVESIANLMLKDCDPALTSKEITRNDIMMLTALYGTSDDRLQNLQRVRIQSKMRRMMEADQEAGR